MGNKRSRKNVFNVGVNDVGYSVHQTTVLNGKQVITWSCPYYKKWYNMLRRCYDSKFLVKNPTYIGCYVDPDWLYLSNFIKWVDRQPNRNWEKCDLDKDLLVKGNKFYSENTCIFITSTLNNFIVNISKDVKGYYFKDGKFYARCRNHLTKKTEHLGAFSCEVSAKSRWKSRKIEIGLLLCLDECMEVRSALLKLIDQL